MAILNQPTGDRSSYTFIRSFRPSGSTTVVWAQEMRSQRMYHFLRWGGDIYLPVGDGDHIGIGVYNGGPTWRAYPAYIEAKNLWEGGPSQPEDCSTDHMWELQPWQRMVMDALMNPGAQKGRPLVVVESGTGFGIGEATFGTEAYRGQIRLYERLMHGGGHQYERPTNVGVGEPEFLGGMRGVVKGGGPESFGGPTRSRGAGPATRGSKGPAAIGAGAEEYRGHYETGVTYQRNAQPVVFLKVEYRSDLQRMLNQAWGTRWDWFWQIPVAPNWWDEPWTWQPGYPEPTAPQVPVAPHRPRNR